MFDSPSTADVKVTLEVGERRFITTADTLTEKSRYFSALLSGRWRNLEAGKPYFIDMDGDVFEHTLRYLRNGVFPIFYDKSKGHDYGLYTMLLEQARYLQISPLENWLEKKSYLQAISVTTSFEEVELADLNPEKTTTDVDVAYQSSYRTRKVYVCPRGIAIHRGQPNKCGKACRRAKEHGEEEDVDDEEEEEVVVVSITRTKTEFHERVCTEEAQ